MMAQVTWKLFVVDGEEVSTSTSARFMSEIGRTCDLKDVEMNLCKKFYRHLHYMMNMNEHELI